MENTTGAGAENAAAEPSRGPTFALLSQYLKDFSFENPNAPGIFGAVTATPTLERTLDLTVTPVSGADHEVALRLKGHATVASRTLYVVDVVYAGLVRVAGASEELTQAALRVQVAQMLFPFVRQQFLTAVRDGGYPSPALPPVDFVALYRRDSARPTAADAEAPKTLQMEVSPDD